MGVETVGTPLWWCGFVGFVLAMLALDLGVFHRKAVKVKLRAALSWAALTVVLALAFNGLVWKWFGAQKAAEFFTGYLLEESLSVDNIFVFALTFSAFRVPGHLQHRVLFWGILGALIMRAAFIIGGAALVARFDWVMYLFGAILLASGAKLLAQGDADEAAELKDRPLVRLFRRLLPMTDGFRGEKFFTREGGRILATPLFLALLVIEMSDVIFAVDSIPAIFGVTRDPFIVFTSNIFAILGLRSIYFVLAAVLPMFHLLKKGISLVLIFIGIKILLEDVVHVPIWVSLSTISVLVFGSILLSRLLPPAPVADEHT